MKALLFITCLLIGINGIAQLNSGTPVIQKTTQPVPNATTTEKSAPPQPIIIAPPANPVPPVYPGGNVKAVEIPRQLINPPVTPSGTQPIQKEPLSPVESTNALKPNRPPRDEASRKNQPVSIPSNVPAVDIINDYKTINGRKVTPVFNTQPILNTNKRVLPAKPLAKKKVTANKKPRY